MRRKTVHAFGALAALSCAALAVWHLRKISLSLEKLAGAREAAPPVSAPPPVQTATAPLPCTPEYTKITANVRGEGEVMLNGVDDATAAMIMAIVLHNTGSRPGDLHFLSIKEA